MHVDMPPARLRLARELRTAAKFEPPLTTAILLDVIAHFPRGRSTARPYPNSARRTRNAVDPGTHARMSVPYALRRAPSEFQELSSPHHLLGCS